MRYLNAAQFLRARLAIADLAQIIDVPDGDDAVLDRNRAGFLQIAQHPVDAFARAPDVVGQLGVRQLEIDSDAVFAGGTVAIGKPDERGAKRPRFSVHHQIPVFCLGQPMHVPHPVHKFDRQIPVLPQQNFKVAFLHDADFAPADGVRGESVHRVAERIELAEEIARMKDRHNIFLAFHRKLRQFDFAGSDEVQPVGRIPFAEDVRPVRESMVVHDLFQLLHAVLREAGRVLDKTGFRQIANGFHCQHLHLLQPV